MSNIGTGSNTRGSDAGPHHKEVSDGIHALTRDVQSIITKQVKFMHVSYGQLSIIIF